jgi:hypothetical protein
MLNYLELAFKLAADAIGNLADWCNFSSLSGEKDCSCICDMWWLFSSGIAKLSI